MNLFPINPDLVASTHTGLVSENSGGLFVCVYSFPLVFKHIKKVTVVCKEVSEVRL